MKNIFPKVEKVNFIPTHLGVWQLPKSRIGETINIGGQKIKKLLTMDINIPEENFANSVNNSSNLTEARKVFAKNYPCPHACPGCFNNTAIDNNPIMTLEEVMDVVDQGIELGLESVKFLGPGELIANPNLFQILNMFLDRNITVGIFTKGAILGSDVLSQKYQGINSVELVTKLASYDNITFLIGGRSFDPVIENRAIPTRDNKLRKQFNYHQVRSIAIERLCAAGMNADPENQRLSIQCNPVTSETIDGIFEIFKWGTERNIPVCVTTTMVSGKGHRLIRGQQELEFERKYKKLAVKIYLYLLEKGIMSLDQLRAEGVSAYVGTSPCNQLSHGLYIHYDGEVWMCPGNDTQNFIVHRNVRENPLLDIWLGSKNYRINKFNNKCVKDGITIPPGFYEDILKEVLIKYK